MQRFISWLWHSLRSEVSKHRQLEFLFAAVKFLKLIGLRNEELLVFSEKFLDHWFEETFIWILAALFMANITKNLDFQVF